MSSRHIGIMVIWESNPNVFCNSSFSVKLAMEFKSLAKLNCLSKPLYSVSLCQFIEFALESKELPSNSKAFITHLRGDSSQIIEVLV